MYHHTRTFVPKLLLLFTGLFLFHHPTPASAFDVEESAGNYLTLGIGLEQLTYREQIPDIELFSSKTDLTNWVLLLEGRKAVKDFFIGAKGYIPVSTDAAQEQWTREGELEQTNSLEYSWTRINVHWGYFLHRLLNPYVGVGWAYTSQRRSNFENVNNPGIFGETVTEKVNSFSALLGLQGNIVTTSRLSFTYRVEYLLPFYSNVTNNNFPGWEASDVGGYAYSLGGYLDFLITETLAATLQVSGGKQHWAGSDWLEVAEGRVKWPENDTEFINVSLCFNKYY